MRKGKTGISLSFYAVLAFLLAAIGNNTILIFLLGFVILAEKDEWLTKQVIQAVGLSLCSSFLSEVISILRITYQLPFLGGIMRYLLDLSSTAISVVVLLLVIAAIGQVSKGKEANVPFMSTFSDWASGLNT